MPNWVKNKTPKPHPRVLVCMEPTGIVPHKPSRLLPSLEDLGLELAKTQLSLPREAEQVLAAVHGLSRQTEMQGALIS